MALNLDFASDNTAGAAPDVLDAVVQANRGTVPSYGEDQLSARVERQFAEVFECDVAVLLVATGTAANSLALASLTRPWETIYCHRDAHVMVDECGAPEFFSGGAKLVGVDGAAGKIEPAALDAALGGARRDVVHATQPGAMSLTNITEAGTLYNAAETAGLCVAAHVHGLRNHLDGARFANAVVASGDNPADLTWRAGVDVMSFGGTKNGCLGVEAVLFFGDARDHAQSCAYRRKRGGHLFSKSRFLAAQMSAYLEGDLWLRLARRANAAAARLAAGIEGCACASLAYPADGNIVFVDMTPEAEAALRDGGVLYHAHRFGHGDARRSRVRLVCGFATSDEAVDAVVALLRAVEPGAPAHAS